MDIYIVRKGAVAKGFKEGHVVIALSPVDVRTFVTEYGNMSADCSGALIDSLYATLKRLLKEEVPIVEN